MKNLFCLIIACLILGTVSPTYADSTISSLSEVTGQPAPQDEAVIVDKSDTSMGSTGTNKKIPLFSIAGLSGISPFTDNTYPVGGVTLTQEHFGQTFTFDGATSYQVWFPEINSSNTGWCIEFAKLGTGQLTIYARSGDFINQRTTYIIPSTGVSTLAIARLKVLSGTSIVEEFSYNVYSGTTPEYLTQINQPLSTGVTPTFAGAIINGLISALSGVSAQGTYTLYDTSGSSIFYVDASGVTIFKSGTPLISALPTGVSAYIINYNSPSTTIGPSGVTTDNLRVETGVSVPELNCESGITTPTTCLWQAESGESIFVTGTSLYFSDSSGVDHALH
jgi:hypothetical protein